MDSLKKKYDIIVIGAGHAGCEAALASARMGCSVLIVAMDLDKIAAMPCSPSIGGMAKGQMVKEIDALGGEMAKISDKSAIQYKTLNTRKGPAVHSLRTQNDKNIYHKEMKLILESQNNLDLKQTVVEKLIVENKKVAGIEDFTGFCWYATNIILATGTFLSGLIHIGTRSMKAGRAGEFASYKLAAQLTTLGFHLGRLKTGTPPRLNGLTIDFSQFIKHLADENPNPFSFSTKKINLPQLSSYIGHTNHHTHNIIRKNIKLSALHSGRIKGIAARYCPSLEDKVIRFSDRERHQIILEPEGLNTNEIYASGLGNSLPMDIQLKLVRSVKGLEEAEIVRPAYAIEYDYINPIGLYPTLETKSITGLFMAGQINGTSGYEEAAAQGIWAGINAACKIQKRKPFILDRSQAYIGVMIDDLVTKGTNEPYRMFTSRAEYRLLLREDNADIRLTKIANSLDLVKKDVLLEIIERKKQIKDEIRRIKKTVIKPTEKTNHYLKDKESSIISNGVHLDQLLKRTKINYDIVDTLAKSSQHLSNKVTKQVEIEIKYEGYIKRQQKEIEKFQHLEKIKIPSLFDFSKTHGLSNELKDKLLKIKPTSVGQASRIEGITPAALTALLVNIKTISNAKLDTKLL